jgi:predicted ATPase
MIVTKKLVEDLGTNKFIPIIRQTLWEDKTPDFLKERVYIDFTDDDQFEKRFEELLHERLLVPPLQRPDVPHIEVLSVKNYRALRDIELKQLKPLTVFLGANGSGKSTFFDVFAFLSECFTGGLRQAWNKRGGLKELRTRGCNGPIEFELKYREKPKTPIITYHLSIDENAEGPFVGTEWLQWRRGSRGKHVRFLNFHHGKGSVIPGEKPDKTGTPIKEQLDEQSTLAVNMFGQSAQHPRVSALRRFITDWHLSDLSTDATRQATNDGPQKRLSPTGDNLPNVIQYLQERYPERLEKIISSLSNQVPRLEKVDTELMMNGRRLLKIKDAPFEQPILAKFASDGTLKLLSYLTLFHDPQPPQLIGIEEPENYLHPRLLTGLVGECLEALMFSQLIITTHSPRFVNELRAEEVWVLYRDEQGFTVCKRASEMLGIEQLLDAGAKLGQLWMEGHFEFGDPLTNAGGPKRGVRAH